ncbi:MAG: HD domain-containing phosphohydrolase [Acidobacteriota bacterium]
MEINKVLIADDENDIRDLLADFLEEKNFKCFLAKNAFEAFDIFKKNPGIDLVMSDIRMPGRSGLDLLGDIKSIDEDVIVIMISAVKDIESAITAMSKGAYDYVSKPFKLAEVGIVIDKAIDKRKLILENREYQRGLEIKVEERTAELKNALDQLDKTYRTTLEALVTALDMRDEETQGHSMRVLHYSLKLADLLGIVDSEKLKILEYGALLHDIGKIGIPDSILKKPSELTEHEWEIMRTHPVVGYKILNSIEFLDEASKIVLHHHENYNGSGYPDKLKGEEIPLGARIFAVADTLDAITSKRAYRDAMSFNEALSELNKYKGIRFDPDMIIAFNSVGIDFWENESKILSKKNQSMGKNHLNFNFS